MGSSMHISIIIPSYHEPNIADTLWDLEKAYVESPVSLSVYVILNDSERDAETVRAHHRSQLLEIDALPLSFSMDVIHLAHVQHKKAGVGHARKTGMDRAVGERGADRSHVLVCLDADCRVRKDYLKGWTQIYKNREIDAAVMQFEHLTDSGSEPLDQAIIEYESHLRYYHQLQYLSGYPHAMQPIGSCLSVRADFYQKIGGMNRRKAGEDFYFLQKCQLNGTVAHASNSKVYPSNRVSKRVPFGTGRAMMERLVNPTQFTYDFACLPLLKDVVSALSQTGSEPEQLWQSLPTHSRPFFETEGLWNHWIETARHTRTPEAFSDRIFRWFHPFRFMKLMHHLRDSVWPSVPIEHALHDYYVFRDQPSPQSMEQALQDLRKWGEQDGLWKDW